MPQAGSGFPQEDWRPWRRTVSRAARDTADIRLFSADDGIRDGHDVCVGWHGPGEALLDHVWLRSNVRAAGKALSLSST